MSVVPVPSYCQNFSHTYRGFCIRGKGRKEAKNAVKEIARINYVHILLEFMTSFDLFDICLSRVSKSDPNLDVVTVMNVNFRVLDKNLGEF